MRWIPQPGDLVGVKKMGMQGIVIESRDLPLLSRISGERSGCACVLVEGDQLEYNWNDLYHIPTDDDQDDE
jgi:hypothetical protein